jgi:hypothetical protein
MSCSGPRKKQPACRTPSPHGAAASRWSNSATATCSAHPTARKPCSTCSETRYSSPSASSWTSVPARTAPGARVQHAAGPDRGVQGAARMAAAVRVLARHVVRGRLWRRRRLHAEHVPARRHRRVPDLPPRQPAAWTGSCSSTTSSTSPRTDARRTGRTPRPAGRSTQLTGRHPPRLIQDPTAVKASMRPVPRRAPTMSAWRPCAHRTISHADRGVRSRYRRRGLVIRYPDAGRWDRSGG